MSSARLLPFGRHPDGRPVDLIVLENGGFRAELLTQGAILRSWIWPAAGGGEIDVVLGCESAGDYVVDTSYHGAVVGRYGNRIAGGRFVLDGREYQLPINNGPNHLHGGSPGFDKLLWDATPDPLSARVTFRLHRPDGDQGYPGDLSLEVDITLGETGELRYDYRATANAPTILNPTAHAYFNLAGHDAGAYAGDHTLEIYSDDYIPKDTTGIPTGEIASVTGTAYDFRSPRAMVEPAGHAELAALCGYDHTWVIRDADGTLRPAARVRHDSGRGLEVLTTEPGIHFYNGHYNDGSPAKMKGTGKPAASRSGFALETQHFPDSPNQPEFPPVVLRPGEVFQSTTIYRPV